MKKLTPLYCAVWHHRHGTDVFVHRTKAGRIKSFAETAVENYLDEIEDTKVQDKIKALCKAKKYHDAVSLWGQAREDEYVDFYTSYLKD